MTTREPTMPTDKHYRLRDGLSIMLERPMSCIRGARTDKRAHHRCDWRASDDHKWSTGRILGPSTCHDTLRFLGSIRKFWANVRARKCTGQNHWDHFSLSGSLPRKGNGHGKEKEKTGVRSAKPKTVLQTNACQ